jgi:uncharacterized membrane protein
MSVELPHNPDPYIPPPSDAPAKTIAILGLADVAKWLRLAASDMVAHPGISGFYGLLVGPFLAMGLYEVSRRREAGGSPDLASSLTCWDSHIRSMGMLVLVLIVLELLWGRASLVVFAVFFNTGMPSTTGVLQAVFNPDNWEFLVAYAVVGAGFAALVFSIAVVSIPMILDRDTDAVFAAITSLEVVFHNTFTMVAWGLCITALVAMALLTPWALGLVVVGPLLGHASWHAYRGAVQWPAELVAVSESP